MWPPEVEQVAAFFRAAGAEARLEELAPGQDDFPGVGIRILAFESEGRRMVTLVPADRAVDTAKLGHRDVRPTVPPAFPFADADVRIENTLLAERTVWIHVGSPRHVVGMSPAQLSTLVRATPADLVAKV
ncbi:MAG TPA: hypothetical protein VE736_13315 [Gaiellaceae bacterium]|nr:hypothetical protein [Gaiellaceae bacterium]